MLRKLLLAVALLFITSVASAQTVTLWHPQTTFVPQQYQIVQPPMVMMVPRTEFRQCFLFPRWYRRTTVFTPMYLQPINNGVGRNGQ